MLIRQGLEGPRDLVEGRPLCGREGDETEGTSVRAGIWLHDYITNQCL